MNMKNRVDDNIFSTRFITNIEIGTFEAIFKIEVSQMFPTTNPPNSNA